MAALGAALIVAGLCVFLFPSWNANAASTAHAPGGVRRNTRRVKVFVVGSNSPVAKKKRRELGSQAGVEFMEFDVHQQKTFLSSNPCVEGDSQRFAELVDANQPHLAHELWKYCVLWVHGGAYIDVESPLLQSMESVFTKESSVAVLSSHAQYPGTIQGSLILLRDAGSPVAEGMAKLLVTTPVDTLIASPLLIPRTLHDLVSQQVGSSPGFGKNKNNWWLYEHECLVDPLKKSKKFRTSQIDYDSYRVNHHCPSFSEYCCQIVDHESREILLVTRYPIVPYQVLPPISELPHPLNAEIGAYEKEELAYISTVTEKVNEPPKEKLLTLNFFDTLHQNNCLPSEQCTVCIREKKGANCSTCQSVCPCYCKSLCNISVEDKFVRKELTVTPPLYARDPLRIIPRIVHQTWFEAVTREKYPNMSRLIESFKQSGWDYRFYTDEVASKFLETHFPSEVKQAYDALRPGAFKADLFRYCVLLIHGGVYADMDVMLESNLDFSVAPDIGFMVPVDEVRWMMRMVLRNHFHRMSHVMSSTAWYTGGYAHVPMEWIHCGCSRTSFLGKSYRDCCQQRS